MPLTDADIALLRQSYELADRQAKASGTQFRELTDGDIAAWGAIQSNGKTYFENALASNNAGSASGMNYGLMDEIYASPEMAAIAKDAYDPTRLASSQTNPLGLQVALNQDYQQVGGPSKINTGEMIRDALQTEKQLDASKFAYTNEAPGMGGSHKANGVELVPGAEGFDINKARPYLDDIARQNNYTSYDELMAAKRGNANIAQSDINQRLGLLNDYLTKNKAGSVYATGVANFTPEYIKTVSGDNPNVVNQRADGSTPDIRTNKVGTIDLSVADTPEQKKDMVADGVNTPAKTETPKAPTVGTTINKPAGTSAGATAGSLVGNNSAGSTRKGNKNTAF